MKYYIAVYDVASGGVRRRIVKELNRWGERVQKSVFEICIGDTDLEKLRERICRIMEENDSFRFYIKDDLRNSYLGGNEVEYNQKTYEVV